MVGLALAGCAHHPAPRLGDAVLAPSPAILAPDASPGLKATLRLGSPPTDKKGSTTAMEFETTVERHAQGAEIAYKLLSGGEVLERETYESKPDAFRIVSTADEAFSPPLDLLRYPVREGAAWNWEGKVVYGGISRDGQADVTISSDGGDVRSVVALAIEAEGSGPEIRRKLVFWFRKGQGVVARSFGEASSRRPVGEPWRP